MKRLIAILALSIFLLPGCSSQPTGPDSTTTASTPTESPQASPKTISSYEDEVIFCQYDSSLLQAKDYGKSSNFSYMWVALPIGHDTATAITDGDCIYICTYDPGDDYRDVYETLPAETTNAFFDGVFQRDPSLAVSTKKGDDNLYEYSLSQSGYSFKGKILSATNESITVIVYRVSDDSPLELINAFDKCYDSITYLKPGQAVEITEGNLYDSITAIHPEVAISNSPESLSISINLSHDSYEKDSIMFYDIITSICQSCELEKYHSDITFSLMVDGDFITMLFLNDYISPTSFISMEPLVILVDEYAEPITDLYWISFSNHDAQRNFDRQLDKIMEKYSPAKSKEGGSYAFTRHTGYQESRFNAWGAKWGGAYLSLRILCKGRSY